MIGEEGGLQMQIIGKVVAGTREFEYGLREKNAPLHLSSQLKSFLDKLAALFN